MDWAKVITDLEANGWTLTRIAAEVGLSVASVSDIKQGRSKEPRGMAAVRLHDLAAALEAAGYRRAPDAEASPARKRAA